MTATKAPPPPTQANSAATASTATASPATADTESASTATAGTESAGTTTAGTDLVSPASANFETARPESPRELFIAFSLIAAQGFGGVLPIIQRELVDKRRWFQPEEFAQEWALAQILPGPNVVNFSLMLGDRYFGIRGAVAAAAGILLLPLLIMIVLALCYQYFGQLPFVAGALRGLGAATAGLLAATALRMLLSLRHSALGLFWLSVIALSTFCLVALAHLPLASVVLGLGLPSCLIAAWRIRQAPSIPATPTQDSTP